MQLETIMNESSEYAEMYQEAYQQEKLDQEYEWQKVDDAHTRFDYFKDDKKMQNKVKDPRYDLTGPIVTEDEYMTTDIDDSDIDGQDREIYRKYKAVQSINKEEVKDMDEEFKKFHRSAKAYAHGDRDNYKNEKKW